MSNTNAGYLILYLVGAGIASFVRGFFIVKPLKDYKESEWYLGNIFLPLGWPIYLPLSVGHKLGDLVARMLEE